MTSLKSYWSILKIFLNNKKIPCIPPLLHENKFIIDFRRKTEIFNTFFVKQCSLINTSSDLPTTLTKKTHESLSTIRFKSHLNYLNHVLKMENFLLSGKKQMLFLCIKKEIRKYWKITVLYLCFPLPKKYLKEYYITICLNFLQKMT